LPLNAGKTGEVHFPCLTNATFAMQMYKPKIKIETAVQWKSIELANIVKE
jgi:hypothetical protein